MTAKLIQQGEGLCSFSVKPQGLDPSLTVDPNTNKPRTMCCELLASGHGSSADCLCSDQHSA